MGIAIDGLKVSLTLEAGGFAGLYQKINDLITKVIDLPNKFSEAPESATFELLGLFSEFQLITNAFSFYVPKCVTFVRHFIPQ